MSVKGYAKKCFNKLLYQLGNEWLLLTLLGMIMAILSFIMDYVIEQILNFKHYLYKITDFSTPLQFFVWILFPIILINFSTGFVHIFGSNAVGSGIPEMKTILRGVTLKKYLTFRTLIAKVIGLISSIGSGLPIGKEGPFVHIASIIASLLNKLSNKTNLVFQNETRATNLLAAACAVGVASTFAAPIGGLLFSIEVTSTFFAVTNYWKGFYTAVCGALIFRLLSIWFRDEETITALYKTDLYSPISFDPLELFVFAIIGIVCGLAGGLFIFLNRKLVEFFHCNNRFVPKLLSKKCFLIPTMITLVICSLTYPKGLGQFMAGELTSREAINQLFSNVSWTNGQSKSYSHEEEEIVHSWKGSGDNIYLTLTLFILMRFWMTALAITLPVPSGIFIPVFTLGAAFGRLIGESMTVWFPNGVSNADNAFVVPAGYAIVGAASFAGAVTHTVSTSVIVFELTGHLGHILPCVISVLFANAICHCLSPNIYDSCIFMKKLPYLPNVELFSKLKNIPVKEFMTQGNQLAFVTKNITFQLLNDFLQKFKYKSFPVIDNDTKYLVGSVTRNSLDKILKNHIEILKEQEQYQFSEEFSDNNETDSNDRLISDIKMDDILVKQMDDMADINDIDSSPFQLISETTFLKVHCLFQALNLKYAYVTDEAKLVGVVGFKEMRNVITNETTITNDTDIKISDIHD